MLLYDLQVHNVAFSFELMQDVGLPQPKARPEGNLFFFLNDKCENPNSTEHLNSQTLSTWTLSRLFESCTICSRNTGIFLKFVRGRETSSCYMDEVVNSETMRVV